MKSQPWGIPINASFHARNALMPQCRNAGNNKVKAEGGKAGNGYRRPALLANMQSREPRPHTVSAQEPFSIATRPVLKCETARTAMRNGTNGNAGRQVWQPSDSQDDAQPAAWRRMTEAEMRQTAGGTRQGHGQGHHGKKVEGKAGNKFCAQDYYS